MINVMPMASSNRKELASKNVRQVLTGKEQAGAQLQTGPSQGKNR